MPVLAPWDGSFKFLDVPNNTWYASDINDALSMSGPTLCNAVLTFNAGNWQLQLGNDSGGLIWQGLGPATVSPLGIYVRTSGLSSEPPSVTIIGSVTPEVDITPPASCFSS